MLGYLGRHFFRRSAGALRLKCLHRLLERKDAGSQFPPPPLVFLAFALPADVHPPDQYPRAKQHKQHDPGDKDKVHRGQS